MPSVITRVLFFVSSYFPLSLIFFVILLAKHLRIAIVILVCGAIGSVWMLLYLRAIKKFGGQKVTVAGFQKRDAEAMAYIVTYVIPFLAIPFSDWRESTSLVIFFGVLGILYINSNMIYINPMLNLCGYHLYEVTLDDGSVHSLITRRRIYHGITVTAVRADDDILVEKPDANQ